MEGAMSFLSGPLRPIPHRPPPLDPLSAFPLHLPLPMHLRLPWKSSPLLPGVAPDTKLPPSLFSPLPSLPHLPHPLALFQHLRRHHHSLMASERMAAAAAVSAAAASAGGGGGGGGDVVLPKTSLPLPLTSPIPGLPAPAALHSMLSMPGIGARGGGGGGVEDRLSAGGEGGPPPAAGLSSPLLAGDAATSPYGRKLFPCPQCRYTTDRRNNLKRHMLTMHQLTPKTLDCCGVLFSTKAALREHALVFHYHGYTCFYCARRFCRKALLKRHLSVHSGQKEFLCSLCDYATSHKSNLERHRRVHMRQDDDTSGGGMMMMMDEGAPSGTRGGGGGGETSGNASEDDISVCSHDDDGSGSGGGGQQRQRRHHHRDHHHREAFRRDDVNAHVSDDVKSNVSESNSNVSCDELSVCSDDEDEEINVHSV